MFHVYKLKHVIGNHPVSTAFPTHSEVDEEILVELETILQQRQSQKEDQTVEQVLVKWKGKGFEDATWIDLSSF